MKLEFLILRTLTTKTIGFVILIISFVLFSAGIRRSSIYILDESKNAQCSWELMHSPNHIIPTFNGQLRTDKPALHYYVMMAGYKIFGKSSTGARFFSSISGALLIWIIFIFVNRYGGRSVALWTVLILLASILWTVEFHLSVPDPYLITLLTLGFFTFFHFTENNSRWSVILMYLCFSLSFLTKGPIAIGLPAIVIFIYLIIIRRFTLKFLCSMLPLQGLIIFLITALPWYFLVHIATDGEWTREFFFDQNIDRFIRIKEGHGGIFLLTLGYYAIGMLPFFVFIPGVIRNAWKERESNLIIFSSLITIIFLTFFSISRTKLPNYTMPSFPFAAIIMAFYLSKTTEDSVIEQVNVRTGLWILFVISLLIPTALTFGVDLEPLISHDKSLGIWFAFMPLGTVLALFYENKLQYRKAFLAVALTFILAGLVFNNITIPLIDKHNPVNLNLDLLKRSASVKYYRTINPSFIFNYGEIGKLNDTIMVRDHLKDTSNILITSMKTINEAPDFWENYSVVFSGKDLFDANHTVIVKSNR
jgi:4-amino-4-deoxy-L-arabinose transferase-like glycosyltransferase